MGEGWVYFVASGDGRRVKIGHSSNLKQRLGSLRQKYGRDLRMLGYMPGDLHTEYQVHQMFERHRLNQKYLHLEWFRLTDEIEDYIKSNTTNEYPLPSLSCSASVLLSPEEYDRVKTAARSRGMTIASFMRKAIEEAAREEGLELDLTPRRGRTHPKPGGKREGAGRPPAGQ